MMDIKRKRKQGRDIGIFWLFTVSLIFSSSYNSTAQEKNASIHSISLDKSIRYGRISNGLTYYIKPLPGSKERVQMRLIHKVGSNDEKEDERDFAHAIEHLAFKSTKKFPLGVENSAIFNRSGKGNYEADASSGPQSTNFQFNIHNSTPEGLRLGLLWFKEIAQNLELTKEDIERVRAEVREEFLGKVATNLNSSVATSKMYSRIFPCEQDEEGLLGHYEYFSPEKIRRFYLKWYHPKNLAVVIVGEIKDPSDLEKQIHSIFSELPPGAPSGERRPCDSLYFGRPPQFAVVQRKVDFNKLITDKSAEMHLIFRLPEFQQRLSTIDKAKRKFLLKMMVEILNERSREKTEQYGMSRPMVYDLFDQGKPSALEIFFSLENGAGKKTIKNVVSIYHQLQEYGVQNPEFNRVKEKLLFNLNWVKENQPKYWLDQISGHFTKEQALPDNKREKMLKSLTEVNLKELNSFIKEKLAKSPEDIGITAPVGHEALLYKEEEIRSFLTKAFKEPVEPYQIAETKKLLSDEEVERLDAASYLCKGIDKSGATEFIFNNGVKLVLLSKGIKGSSVNQSSIDLHGFRIGGAEFLPEEDYWSAVNAPGIILNSGVNGLNKFELNDFLDKHQLLFGGVAPYIDYSEHGIYGRAKSENLETMLQLVYLYFKKPNRNVLAFKDWKNNRIETYLNFSADLYATDFNNARRKASGDNYLPISNNTKHIPNGTINFLSLEKTEYDKAVDTYERFFNDAEGFTFLITGKFEIKKLLPLAQKYLGNLPGVARGKMGKLKKPFAFSEGPSFQELPNLGNLKMPNVSYGTSFILKPENTFDWKERLKIELLGEVVRQKMWNLRFKKGYGLYNVSARGKYNYDLKRYEISTYLFCQPQDYEILQEEVKNIYSEVKAGEISEEEFAGALELVELFNFSERAKRLGVEIQELYNHYRFNYPWVGLSKMKNFISEVDRQDLTEVANKYIKKENFHEFVIRNN